MEPRPLPSPRAVKLVMKICIFILSLCTLSSARLWYIGDNPASKTPSTLPTKLTLPALGGSPIVELHHCLHAVLARQENGLLIGWGRKDIIGNMTEDIEFFQPVAIDLGPHRARKAQCAVGPGKIQGFPLLGCLIVQVGDTAFSIRCGVGSNITVSTSYHDMSTLLPGGANLSTWTLANVNDALAIPDPEWSILALLSDGKVWEIKPNNTLLAAESRLAFSSALVSLPPVRSIDCGTTRECAVVLMNGSVLVRHRDDNVWLLQSEVDDVGLTALTAKLADDRLMVSGFMYGNASDKAFWHFIYSNFRVYEVKYSGRVDRGEPSRVSYFHPWLTVAFLVFRTETGNSEIGVLGRESDEQLASTKGVQYIFNVPNGVYYPIMQSLPIKNATAIVCNDEIGWIVADNGFSVYYFSGPAVSPTALQISGLDLQSFEVGSLDEANNAFYGSPSEIVKYGAGYSSFLTLRKDGSILESASFFPFFDSSNYYTFVDDRTLLRPSMRVLAEAWGDTAEVVDMCSALPLVPPSAIMMLVRNAQNASQDSTLWMFSSNPSMLGLPGGAPIQLASNVTRLLGGSYECLVADNQETMYRFLPDGSMSLLVSQASFPYEIVDIGVMQDFRDRVTSPTVYATWLRISNGSVFWYGSYNSYEPGFPASVVPVRIQNFVADKIWVFDYGVFLRSTALGGQFALGDLNSGALGTGDPRVAENPRYELVNPKRVLWDRPFLHLDCRLVSCVAVDSDAVLVRWGWSLDALLPVVGFPRNLAVPRRVASSILASRPVVSVKHAASWAIFQTDMLVYNSSVVITQGAPVISIQGIDFGTTARLFDIKFAPPFDSVACEIESCTDSLIVCRLSKYLPTTGPLVARISKFDDLPYNGEWFQLAQVVSGHGIVRTPSVAISQSSTLIIFNATGIVGQVTDYRVTLFNANSSSPINCATVSVGETITCSLAVTNALVPGPLTVSLSTNDGFSAREVIGQVVLPATISQSSGLPFACAPGTINIMGANFGGAGDPQPVVSFSPALFSCSNANAVRINSTALACQLFGPDTITGVLVASVSFAGSTSASVPVANLLPAPSVSSSSNLIAAAAESVIIFGTSFGFDVDAVSVNLSTAPSNSARRHTLDGVNISCDVISASDTQIECIPASSFPSAGTLLATVSRAGGVSRALSVGTLTQSPTIISSTANLAASASSLTIRGANFASEPFASNTVDLFPFGNCSSTTLGFTGNIPELSIICTFVSGAEPAEGIPLLAEVGSRRARSPRTPVAVLVPTAVINRSNEQARVGTTRISIRGSNFGSEPGSNFVSLRDSIATRSIPCIIARESSSEIECQVDLSNLTETATLEAAVRAYGGQSAFTTVAVYTIDSSIQGTPPGIVAAAVISVIVIAAAIAVVLVWYIRKRLLLRDIAGSAITLTDEQKAIFNIRAEEIDIVKKLGEGSYGVVYLATWKNRFVAIKKLTSQVQAAAVNEFFREAALMMALKPNPNVVKTFGMCQERNNFSLCMEFQPNGSMDVMLKNPDALLTEERYLELALGIAKGMQSLADQRIVHRDLAARNILLGANNEPKVSDFGYARVTGHEGVGNTANNVGPVRWMPPESIRRGEYSEKSDVWAYGCVLFEMVAREVPHKGKELVDVAVQIRDSGLNPGIPDATPRFLRKLMRTCWSVEPDERPTFAEIVDILEGVDLQYGEDGKRKGKRSKKQKEKHSVDSEEDVDVYSKMPTSE